MTKKPIFYVAPREKHDKQGECKVCWTPGDPKECPKCGGRLHSDFFDVLAGEITIQLWCEDCE